MNKKGDEKLTFVMVTLTLALIVGVSFALTWSSDSDQRTKDEKFSSKLMKNSAAAQLFSQKEDGKFILRDLIKSDYMNDDFTQTDTWLEERLSIIYGFEADLDVEIEEEFPEMSNKDLIIDANLYLDLTTRLNVKLFGDHEDFSLIIVPEKTGEKIEMMSEVQTSSAPINLKSDIISTGSALSPLKTTLDKWRAALQSQSLEGLTWIGKLKSNGYNDDLFLEEKGREVIIFAPKTTDFSKPVELMYFFHGNKGFDVDMNQRLAPQSKKMSEAGRNFVLIFPELPWSAGTNKEERHKRGQKFIWNGYDSDLIKLHDDVLNIIKTYFSSSLKVGLVSMTGHSAGGAAIEFASETYNKVGNKPYGAMDYIKPGKITISDADYFWGDKSAIQVTYENYVSKNPSVEFNFLVQSPTLTSAHDPTSAAINFMATLSLETSAWKHNICSLKKKEICKSDTTIPDKTFETPGAVEGIAFSVSEHPNINYVPLKKGHLSIGKMSLSWESSKIDLPRYK